MCSGYVGVSCATKDTTVTNGDAGYAKSQCRVDFSTMYHIGVRWFRWSHSSVSSLLEYTSRYAYLNKELCKLSSAMG
jgi:hypothetical protein